MNASQINYQLTWKAARAYSETIKDWIGKMHAVRICDIGGGANPLLDLDFVRVQGLEYTVMDISESELAKAPDQYDKQVQNIEAADFAVADRFDLVFSWWLAEHVKNGRLFHQNVHKMLRNGGVAIHYFPTLYALPFLINRLIPEFVSKTLLNILDPRDKFQHGKFPAYYDWCFGPTLEMLNMLHSVGFEILEFNAMFGHPYYYQRFPILRDIHKKYSNYLVHHPNPYLTSFAKVILVKH